MVGTKPNDYGPSEFRTCSVFEPPLYSDQYLNTGPPFEYSNHLNTALVWYWNGRFVSRCQMVFWKPDFKKPIYGPKCPVFEWSAKSHDFTIWILETHTVWYSDESGIKVLGIQMVTVQVVQFCDSDVCYSDPHCLVLIPRKLNNSWMAAELSHLLSVDQMKHKYEKTVKIYFAI